jgi:hypothetical protein
VQCRIQRAFAEGQRIIGGHFKPLGDAVAVRRAEAQRLEDQ